MASLDVVINPRGAQQGAAAVRQALAEIKSAARSTLDTMESGFDRLKSMLFSVKTALAALGLGLAGREILETVVKVDQMVISLKAITGSAAGARSELDFVRQVAARLGLDLAATASQYTMLTAATKGTAIAGQATRDVFLGIAEAASVLHLSGQQVEGTLNALVQMVSQGTVRSQELRLQLGNNIPGALSIAARAMGVTTAELNRMIEKGELLASDFLPRFGAQLRKEFAQGVPEAVNSTQAALNRFTSTVFAMQDTIGRSGFVAGLLAGVSRLTALLQDPRLLHVLGQTGAVLGLVIAKAGDLAQTYLPGLAEAFLDAFKRIAIGGGRLIDILTPVGAVIFDMLKTAWNTYVDITGSVPGLTELGLIGLLMLGTKGRAAVIASLLLFDQLKTGLAKALPGPNDPDSVEARIKVMDSWLSKWFGEGQGSAKLDKILQVAPPDAGPTESAVRAFFDRIAKTARAGRSVLAGTGETQPSLMLPEAQVPEPNRKVASLRADYDLESLQATLADRLALLEQSQTLERAIIQRDLQRRHLDEEQATRLLTDLQREKTAANFRAVTEELAVTRQVTAVKIAQAADEEERMKAKIDGLKRESQLLTEQGKLIKQIAIDRVQGTIQAEQAAETVRQRQLAGTVAVAQAELIAAQAGYASFEEQAAKRVTLLEAQYAEEISRVNLTEREKLAIRIRYESQLRQQTQLAQGGVLEIYKYGLQEYLSNTGNTFNIAIDMARETANAMSQGFKTFFVDVLKGQMTDVKSILTGVRDFAYNVIGEIMARLATAGLLRLIAGSAIGAYFQPPAPTATTTVPQANVGLERYGGIFPPVERYDAGGIARRPQLALFGEGAQSEAFVPLPDGRSIPVTLRVPRPAAATGTLATPVINNQVSIEVFNQHRTAAVQSSQRRGPDGRLMIRMLIKETTQDLMRSGDLDRDMESLWGLRRQGAGR